MDLTDWDDIQEVASTLIKHAVISASSTDNTIVAAVTGKRIRVISVFLTASTVCTVAFESSTTTPLTGTMNFFAKDGGAISTGTATGSLVLPANLLGWFQTDVGELLNLTVSAGTISGSLSYIEI